jgi:hypothetical protein
VRFEVRTVVLMKTEDIWGMTPCHIMVTDKSEDLATRIISDQKILGFQNVSNYLALDIVSYTRRLDTSS